MGGRSERGKGVCVLVIQMRDRGVRERESVSECVSRLRVRTEHDDRERKNENAV